MHRGEQRRQKQECCSIASGPKVHTSSDWETAIVIETETLLEKCPLCGAWPMAAKLPKPSSQPEVRFRCPKCGHQEFGRFRRAGSIQRLSQPAREARHHA